MSEANGQPDIVLALHIQPRAAKDEVVGYHGGRLKVRITAPPVDGQANDHLITFLAGQFKVPRRQVILLSGASGRDKLVRIINPAIVPEFVTAPDK